MTFIDFIPNYKKRKQHQLKKVQKVLSSLSLRDVGTYLRDGSYKTDIGIVNLLPTKGAH